MSHFQNKPFAVFYNKNPNKKEIEALQKSKVEFLFLDSSNINAASNFFKTFNPVVYFNAGAWENFRKYAKPYPANVIGKDMKNWPGEKWLDISNEETYNTLVYNIEKTIRPMMEMNKNWRPKIDLDNLDSFAQDTGFKISKSDEINYINNIASWFNKTFGGEVSARNSSEIINDIKVGAILCEQGLEDKFLSKYKNKNIPIFDIEYYKNGLSGFVGQKVCKDYRNKNPNVRFVGADDGLNVNYFNI